MPPTAEAQPIVPEGVLYHLNRFTHVPDNFAMLNATPVRFLKNWHLNGNILRNPDDPDPTVTWPNADGTVDEFGTDDIAFQAPARLGFDKGPYPVIVEWLRRNITPGDVVVLNLEQGDAATRLSLWAESNETRVLLTSQLGVLDHARRIVDLCRSFGAIVLGVYGLNYAPPRLEGVLNPNGVGAGMVAWQMTGALPMIMAGIEGEFDLRKQARILSAVQGLNKVCEALGAPDSGPIACLVLRPYHEEDGERVWESEESWNQTIDVVDAATNGSHVRALFRNMLWADGARVIRHEVVERYLARLAAHDAMQGDAPREAVSS